MQIPLMLLILLAMALLLGEVRARMGPKPQLASVPPPPEPACSVAGEDDGLVALPSPDAPQQYTEKAGTAEMLLAGQYFNLVGLLLLTIGFVSYLRVSGFSHRVANAGWLHCLLGAGLGIFLSWAGTHYHRQGVRAYADPLLAAGVGISVLSLGTSYFHFHLLPSAGLALGTFVLVVWAGLAVLRYDSTLTAAAMMAALFLGPLASKPSVSQMGIVIAYLLAINLATTVVAYQKKWDSLLITSFLGSYALYYHLFGLDRPWPTLAFLASTYLLFLLAGNLFHFLRRTSSDFDIWLSLLNPLAFACVSYAVLLKLSNGLALAVYAGVAALHLALAVQASRQRGQGQAYEEMGQTHFALGLLFSTAAISFLTYCDADTGYFGVVTALWMGQAIGLIFLAQHLSAHLAPLARRGSYVALGLAATQLLWVVSTMQWPFLIDIPAILSLLVYFHFHEKHATSREEHLFSNLVLLVTITVGHQTMLSDLFPLSGLVGMAALAPLMLVGYRHYPHTLAAYRWASLAVATVATVTAVVSPWNWNAMALVLPVMAALMAVLTPLARAAGLQWESPLGILLAGLLVLRGSLLLFAVSPGAALIVAALLAFAMLEASRDLERLEPAASWLGLGVVVAAILLPCAQPSALIGPGIALFLCLETARRRISNHPELAAQAGGLAGLLFLKIAFNLHTGAGSTLLWCLLGLALLRKSDRLAAPAQILFFLAFLKAISLDANFIMGSGGWEVAAMRTPDPLHLLLVVGVVSSFFAAAHLSRQHNDWRNYFNLFGLLVFAFQTTLLLYNLYGVLDTFQVLLSGFWAGSSLLFIAYGIHGENKLFRLFGLTVLIACLLKIYAVDIWVLDAYDKTTTTLALGSLLMVVSFLYQTNRTRLTGQLAGAVA